MSYGTLLTVVCPDRVGLISAITARLFDLGVNLGGTSFEITDGEARFTALCNLPDETTLAELEAALSPLPELGGGRVRVSQLSVANAEGPEGTTHAIECTGHDQPGLIARLSEIFIEYDANILAMRAERLNLERNAGDDSYVIRFFVHIPAGRADACLATLANTAGALHMVFRFRSFG